MAQEVTGVKATKEVIDLVLTGIKVAEGVAKDGKVGIDDIAYVTQLFPVVGPAFSDMSQVPSEIADLSAEEAADLVAYVSSKLALDSPKAQAIVDAALKAAYANYSLYQAIKA